MSTYEHASLHGGSEADDAIRRRKAGCCTPCWSIFLAIAFGSSLITSFSFVVRCAGGCRGVFSGGIVFTLIEFLCAVFCAYAYFVSNPSAQILTWNYAAWIVLAINASLMVIVLVIVAILVFTAGLAFTAAAAGTGEAGAAGMATGLLGGLVLAVAGIVAIPMIINSVLAARAKVPCQCSGGSRY